MEHRAPPRAGGGDSLGIGEVAKQLTHAQGLELGGEAALVAVDGMAARQQGRTQGLAEEAAAAGDQDIHHAP